MVAVERAHVEVELGVVLPRGRHEHRERVPDVAPAAHEQLGRVVEHPGVGARLVERRDAVERAGPRAHPVHVAADRVDLAVVAQQAERLRPLPRGLGIGREALVEDPERHLEPRIAQIRIEGVELVGGAERLVDDGSEGKGGGVDIGAAVEPLPRGVGAPLGLVGRDPPRTLEHGLGDERRRRARGVAERTARHRRTEIPSAAQARSTARRPSAPRRNTMARPRSGSGTSADGSGRSRPAPSPVRPSAAKAPRWRTRCSASRRASRTSREGRPESRATNPMPQASRSGAWTMCVGGRGTYVPFGRVVRGIRPSYWLAGAGGGGKPPASAQARSPRRSQRSTSRRRTGPCRHDASRQPCLSSDICSKYSDLTR